MLFLLRLLCSALQLHRALFLQRSMSAAGSCRGQKRSSDKSCSVVQGPTLCCQCWTGCGTQT